MPTLKMNTTSSRNAYFDIARGLRPDCQLANIFGFNREVGATFETIWNDGGQYSYLSSAQQLTLSSTSGDDDMDVLIQGLDSNYQQITETVTLNGTNDVTTTNSFLRVNNAAILSGSNVGDISGEYSSTLVFFIEAALGTTQACVYTVPAGYTLYLLRIDLTSGTVQPNKYITYRNRLDSSNGRILRVAEATWQTGMQSFDRQAPFPIPEKTDFQIESKSSSGTNEISIFIEAVLVEN